MNLKHPYEKHLAEKLVQLPPPDDPDQNWQQMKGLLDKNMPRGGGGSGGTFRWWITGTVIVAVVVGTWFGGKQLLTREQRNEAVAGTIKTVNNKNTPYVAPTNENTASDGSAAPKTGGTTGKKNNLPGAAYASTTSTPDANSAAAGNRLEPGTGNNPAIDNNNASKEDAVATNNTARNNSLTIDEAERARSSGTTDNSPLLPTNNSKEPNKTPTSNHNKTNVDRNKLYAPVTKNSTNKTTVNNRPTNTNRRHENNTGADNYRDQPENKVAMNNAVAGKSKSQKEKKPVKKIAVTRPVKKQQKEGRAEKEESTTAYTPSISMPSRSLPSQPSNGSGLEASPVTYNINYTGSLVVLPSGVIQREFTYYTAAELFPDLVAPNKTSNHKSARRSPNAEDDDATFAVGLSLPLAFPVGDQQALGYNRNAGVNTISDYIPSPHFQYHFNNKTYLQAGLQFSAPQFIRPVLLYQNQIRYQQGPNIMEQTTSISARKLYYFNLPVTIYHSPLRNFYMGTGLMYSSLLSGVAHYEKTERKYGPSGPSQDYVINNYFTKFRNDSLSNRLNGNEVRLILDMSYYWSRFTVGFQYTQAFNNYVNLQVTPVSDYTLDKNKSLQFYLRYNIWEDKKRKQPKGQVLTFK